MLRKQIIAAIGKELTPVDFTYYMEWHNRNIFKEEYAPVPFSYAVCAFVKQSAWLTKFRSVFQITTL